MVAGLAAAPGKHAAEKRSALRMEFSDVLRGGDPDAVPARSGRSSADLPVVVVDPVAGGIPADGSCVAVLNEETLEAGIWMSRSATAS